MFCFAGDVGCIDLYRFFIAPPQAKAVGPTIVTTDIASDTTWGPTGSPYLISKTISVGAGATLTILPGTTVKFGPDNYLDFYIHGQLLALGTADAPITFTSGSSTPKRGDWHQIVVSNTPGVGESIISHAVIEYGGYAGAWNGGDGAVSAFSDARVLVTHCEFRNNKGYGFASSSPAAIVRNSYFHDSGAGVSLGSGIVTNNMMAASMTWGIYFITVNEARVTRNIIQSKLSLNFLSSSSYLIYDNDLSGGADANAWVPDSHPRDISGNWWGKPLPAIPSGCVLYDQNYYPPYLTESATSTADPCWAGASSPTKHIISGYLLNLLPALDAPPPTSGVGLQGEVSPPAEISIQQTYGLGEQGSEFAQRPTGYQADPVNSTTGAFVTEATDLSMPALGFQIESSRTYTSADTSVGALGKGWSFGYEASLAITPNDVTMRAPDGQRLAFRRWKDGTYHGATGVSATMVHEPNNVGWTVTTRAGVKFLFAETGALVSQTDRDGNQLVFARDNDQKLTSVSAAGRTMSFTWAGLRLASAVLPDGRTTTYSYNDAGTVLAQVTRPDGAVIKYGYDQADRLTSITLPSGTLYTRLNYDQNTGRVSEQWDANGNHSTFSWDAATQTQTLTDPRGAVWKDTYHGNVLVSRTNPLMQTTRYEYDAQLRPIQVLGPAGETDLMSYNYGGDLVSFQRLGQAAVTTAYNAQHLPITTTTGRRHTNNYTYDSTGHLTKITYPNQATQTFTYTTGGLVATITNPLGNVTNFEYSATGDLITTTSPEGRLTRNSYDTTGRLTSTVSPLGAAASDPTPFITRYEYTLNDQLKSVTDGVNRKWSVTYNVDGRLTSKTDPANRTTTFTYDLAGHPTAIQRPDPAIPAATTTYDANGNVASTTDPRGATTT